MPGTLRPPSRIALAALPGIALDLETTGLDVVHARIVRVGAVAMRGPEVLDAPRIDTRVNPGIPIGSESTRIHRLTDGDVADAPRFPELYDLMPVAGTLELARELHAAAGAMAGGPCVDGDGLEWCRGEDLNLHGVAPTWT